MHWIGRETTPEMKLGAKQLHHLGKNNYRNMRGADFIVFRIK